ncbi:MAG: hypothetical protein R2799_05330 [Crocinitomicaceae bacterium]
MKTLLISLSILTCTVLFGQEKKLCRTWTIYSITNSEEKVVYKNKGEWGINFDCFDHSFLFLTEDGAPNGNGKWEFIKETNSIVMENESEKETYVIIELKSKKLVYQWNGRIFTFFR